MSISLSGADHDYNESDCIRARFGTGSWGKNLYTLDACLRTKVNKSKQTSNDKIEITIQ
jgi:hypothetical protein